MKFGKRLLALRRPEWSAHYLDYKELKKLIRSTVASSLVLPVGSDHSEENPIFHICLAKEIVRIETFFKGLESSCFSEFDIVASEVNTFLSECSQDAHGVNDVPIVSTVLQRFIRFAAKVDAVRKYVVVNSLALLKIMKKHDKKSLHHGVRQKFLPVLNQQRFYRGGGLPTLYSTIESLADRLLSQRNNNVSIKQEEEDTCAICLNVLLNPVSLSCQHSFCWSCLRGASEHKLESCPMCRKAQPLNPSNYRMDGILHKFLVRYFDANLEVVEQFSAGVLHYSQPQSTHCHESQAVGGCMSPATPRLESLESKSSAVSQESEDLALTCEFQRELALSNTSAELQFDMEI